MKKYKVSIDGGPEQIVCASSGDLAALRCHLRDAFNQKLETGESQTVTVTVTRQKYTKEDDAARHRQQAASRPAPEWKPNVGDFAYTGEGLAQVTAISGDEVQIRLVPMVGDVYMTEDGKPYGSVKEVNGDGTCKIVPFNPDEPLPEGATIFNPALAGRQAKYDARVSKEQQQLSVSSDVLGF